MTLTKNYNGPVSVRMRNSMRTRKQNMKDSGCRSTNNKNIGKSSVGGGIGLLGSVEVFVRKNMFLNGDSIDAYEQWS